MPKEQIPSGKAPRALWTFERFLFRMGPFMSFEMFQPGKRPSTSSTDMRSRLVGLGRWEIGSPVGCAVQRLCVGTP